MNSDDIVFKCQKCGKCCRDKKGYVYPVTDDIRKMAKGMNMDELEFRKKYLIEDTALITHLKSNEDGSCVLLKDNKCSIYEFRPQQCATYPFWPQNFTYRANFERVLEECSGTKLKKGNHTDH